MNIRLTAHRVLKSEFHNNMSKGMSVNPEIKVNTNINLANPPAPNQAGNILIRMMLGSPIEPLYFYFEQTCMFEDADGPGEPLDREDLLSIYKTICLPQAIASVEENVNQIFKTYNLPPVNLAQPKREKYN